MSVQFLYLTTTGRTSGLPREIEIWFVEAEGKYYILAEFAHSHWVRNIAKDPSVQVRVGDLEFEATARALDPVQDAPAWETAQRLEREKYGWGDGLPVEITPITSEP
jgi:deazaflavin-dependent oxidoreductase (nitroreductase family)